MPWDSGGHFRCVSDERKGFGEGMPEERAGEGLDGRQELVSSPGRGFDRSEAAQKGGAGQAGDVTARVRPEVLGQGLEKAGEGAGCICSREGGCSWTSCDGEMNVGH